MVAAITVMSRLEPANPAATIRWESWGRAPCTAFTSSPSSTSPADSLG